MLSRSGMVGTLQGSSVVATRRFLPLLRPASAAMATVAAPTTATAKAAPPKLNFKDAQAAYRDKSNGEILRALAVYAVCSQQWVIDIANPLLKLSRLILRDTITLGLVKKTFFAHFCAGEDSTEVKTTLARLQKSNIGAIIDYAAENAEEGIKVSDKECDENLHQFLDSIKMADGTKAFVAVKLTALAPPDLLLTVNDRLSTIREVWNTAVPEKQKGAVNKAQFADLLKTLKSSLSEEEQAKLLEKYGRRLPGHLDYIEWIEMVSDELLFSMQDPNAPKVLPTLSHPTLKPLNPEDAESVKKLSARLTKLGSGAEKLKVGVMIDAEQTYFQLAIDHFTREMQVAHNRAHPIVFNTYQCYLTRTRSHIRCDLERAKRFGFKFAGKLVRGAYMEDERARAKKLGVPSPVHPDIQATHLSYNDCVKMVLEDIEHASILLGTHNQSSIEMTVAKMAENGIAPGGGSVYFAQLLGMADNLTFTLANNGYLSYKYVPYGPVDKVLPYLTRRGKENGAIFKTLGGESEMLWTEYKRRRRA